MLQREPDGTPYDARVGTPERTVFGIGRNGYRPGHWSPALWGAAAGVLPAAAALLSRMRGIDLAYHVRAGEIALASGELVRTDPFTFTRAGRAWLNQQWGAQLVFASAHRLLGWAGVALTYAAALGAGFSILYRSCRRAGADARTSGVLVLLSFLVGATSLGARPQALAVPLFTSVWLLLARRDAWAWLVPGLALVWANVHGSFVLAPALATFAVAEDLLGRRPARRSALIAVATVLASFVTPFGPAVWGYALDVVGDETIRNTVAEWRPPSPLAAGGALFWASGAAVAAVGIRRRRTVRAIDVARLLAFFALGALTVRSTLWWALAAPPVVAGWYRTAAPRSPEGAPAGSRGLVVAAASVAVLALAAGVRAGTDDVTGAPARLADDAPQVLVGATRRALPAGSRLLVFQPFASWFEFALPGYPVMVDSRIELFPDDVWRDYDTVIVAGAGWQEIPRSWRISAIVLPPRAVLADALRDDPAWRPVADVEAGSVFVRR
jgi:hypothetical protein